MQRPLYIFPCDRNPDLGTGISDPCSNSPAVTKNSEKELILNQRYLPFPDSNLADFFFELGCFLTKNPDLQLDFADFVPKRTDLHRKLATLKNVYDTTDF